jgi:TonB-dependent receptor
LRKEAHMKFSHRQFGFLIPVLFYIILISAASVSADTDDPVDGQANSMTASATTAPMDSQGNTMSASATGVSELPEVKVTAKGIDQAAAFDQMHDSLNKVNVLSQDQIKQTPAKSVAQAAEQLPGVGTSHDTSEPRYISIRGTDPDFDIITFNDTIIPSYDKAARSVELDSIPAGLFGELQLYKTILPDMDAQGIGGQLNLEPKYASDYANGLFELQAEGEYFPERNQAGTREQLTWADNYNLGGQTNLGVLVTGGYQYSRFGIDDLENDYTDPANNPLIASSVKDYQFRYYDMERDRAGVGTNINLDFDKENKLYANLMYAGYDEYREPGYHSEYHNIDATAPNATVGPDGTVTVDATASNTYVLKTFQDELTQFRNLASGVGGSNNLGGFLLDYKADFAYAENYVPYNYNYSFRTNAGAVTGSLTYNNTLNNGNNPVFNFGGLGGTDINPNTSFLNGGGSNSTNTYQVSSYGGKADGKFEIPLGGSDSSTVKFGAAARLEYSTYGNASYSAASGAPLALAQLDPTSYTYYNGLYSTGPLPDFNQTTSLLNNGSNQYLGAYTQTDPNGDKGGDYTNWEDVFAEYAMYTIKSGPMEIMTGARIETTHIQYNWNQAYNTLPNGDPNTSSELASPIAETGTIDYTNILPSLGFKYTFNPDMITRMNYSQTIARPTQSQYIPSFSLGQALSAQANNGNVAFTFGNPNLKPMISNNIDFSFELYPEKAAILGVDFFLKDIANYIALNYSRVDGAGGVGSGGVTDSLNYLNIPTSDIYGAEFQYQQQYTSLPGLLSGLGFRGSISFMGSNGELAQGIYGDLPFQSDLIWETGIFYKKDGFTFDVAGNFTGKNLMVIGDPNVDNSPSIYRDDFFQINAKAQYAFTKDFSIYADGNNLNNENLRYYQGSSQYPIQNEYYLPSVDAGIVIDF